MKNKIKDKIFMILFTATIVCIVALASYNINKGEEFEGITLEKSWCARAPIPTFTLNGIDLTPFVCIIEGKKRHVLIIDYYDKEKK